MSGELPVLEWQMEVVMEALETQCYANLQTQMKTVEGLGIEYDENVSCDVCKSVSKSASDPLRIATGSFCDVGSV